MSEPLEKFNELRNSLALIRLFDPPEAPKPEWVQIIAILSVITVITGGVIWVYMGTI